MMIRNHKVENKKMKHRALAAALAMLVAAAAVLPVSIPAEAAMYRPVDTPTLRSPVQLRDYLQTCLSEGVRDCEFLYTGDRRDLEGQYLTRMTNALYCYIRTEQTEDGGGEDDARVLCEVEMVPHMGEAILEAWRSGDLSALSDEELEVLEQALGIVDYLRMEEGLAPLYDDDEGSDPGEEETETDADGEDAEGEDAEGEDAEGEDAEGEDADGEDAEDAETAAEAAAETDISLREQLTAMAVQAAAAPYEETGIAVELRIHDWLCETVEYVKDVPSFSDAADAPPELSAVGALRDGRANCQGYADAFYLLASLAGYEVSFQSADDRSTGTGHVFNTIRLGDAWYAVDVTGDDNSMKVGDQILSDYHLFNAGMDIAGEEFSWPEELTIHPLKNKSDHLYYYYWDADTGTDGYERCFDSAAGIAEAAVSRFRDGEEGTGYFLLRGHEDKTSELDAALSKALKGDKETRKYRYTTVLRGGNTFYRVVIE